MAKSTTEENMSSRNGGHGMQGRQRLLLRSDAHTLGQYI